MTIDAVLMMAVSIAVIWGGFGYSLYRLSKSPQQDKE